MDQNNPARFLDTAYNALKANPGATNQILQAAAQGAPVGLKGLAAAAAQQSQQEAQKSMAALQQQGPQPNIVQKLATQGIMSQMDTGLPIAPQMGAPEQMPQQMMAGGGLVSFADGGNVLPPDVIDAIQSHFAEGGDARGYAGGEDVELSDFERRHPEVLRDTVGSRWSDVLTSHAQTDKDVLGDIADRWKATLGHHAQTDKDVLGPIVDRWKAMHASHLKNSDDFSRGLKQTWEESTSPIGGPIDRAPTMPESDYRLLEEKGAFGPKPPNLLDKISGYIQSQTPKTAVDAVMEDQVGASAPTEQDLSALDRLIENYPRNGILAATKEPSKRATKGSAPATPTWQGDSDPHTGTPATPKAPAHEEATKLDKTFEQAKVDTGTKTTDKNAEASGLNALAPGMDMEKMRDLIMGLGGHKELSPELSQQLGELKDSARTSTIIQSILGGLGGGLTDPYGGRFALGRAALGALGGYQKGIGSEEEIGRKAFDILRGYADAPEEEKTAARDKLLGLYGKAAELQASRDIADLKGEGAYERLLATELGKNLRAGQTQGTKGQLSQGDVIQARVAAQKATQDWVKSKIPRPTDQQISDYESKMVEHYLSGLGSSATSGVIPSSGLGGGPLGSGQGPLIIQRKPQ